MPREIKFDPENHIYTVGERRLPSVTEVMKDARVIDDRWFDEWSRDRGSAVHLAIMLADEGDLDPETVDPRIQGYLDAHDRATKELGGKVTHTELVLGSESLGYAGNPDAVAVVGSTVEVWDWKTGAPGRAGGVQTAAYAALLAECKEIKVGVRRCIQLHDTGKYTVHTYRDKDDYAVFRAALTIYRWRQG